MDFAESYLIVSFDTVAWPVCSMTFFDSTDPSFDALPSMFLLLSKKVLWF